MAYNSVPTTIIGVMLDQDWHNTNITGNMEHFANVHDHGSANHGSRTLGNSGGLISLVLTDGSDPDAPGAGKVIIYAKSGTLFQRAGAAGTPEEWSLTTHTH